MDEHLLEVKNLKVSFKVGKKKLTAVDNVTFSLDRGKVIGIVGESGCRKKRHGHFVMRLVLLLSAKLMKTARSCLKGKICQRHQKPE